MPSSVAVIGTGAAGIAAAWELWKASFDVTLFERDHRLGGHTSTVVIEDGPDAGAAVDTGFIVCNDRTYPNFQRFLAELGCSLQASEMSFGYYDEDTGLQYAGTDLNGLFAQRRNAVSPRFWRVAAGVVAFGRRAKQDLETGGLSGLTLGQYLEKIGSNDDFVRHYAAPMGAAIWSTPMNEMMAFPAETFARFFDNHGLLTLTNRPQWRTVQGGSHTYLRAFETRFRGQILLGSGAESVRRAPGGGAIVTAAGRAPARYDHVVVACHADDALALLAEPSPAEREALGAWRYQKNRTILHTDGSFMPPRRGAWASWNYRRDREESGDGAASVTYDMNRLQRLKTARPYFVTLNPRREPQSGSVIREFSYAHPTYDFAALASQPKLRALNARGPIWYCGAHFGHGFHEDAITSGQQAAAGVLAAGRA